MVNGRNSGTRQRFVDVDGASIYCEKFGAGEPLILLHGGLGSGRDWERVVPHFADDFHVITIDVRGHGRSTNLSGNLTYPLIASDLAQVIEQLEIDRPFIAGWSDGGQHVLQLGSRYPSLPRGLAAGAADYQTNAESRAWVTSFFGLDDEGNVDLAVLDEMLGESAGRYHAKHSGGEEQWRTLAHQTAHLWLEYEGLTNEEYSRISAPTLVMVGDRDDDVPVEDAVKMYRAIPNAELAVCPGADHFIPFRRVDWFVATLRAFLDRCRD